MDTELVVEFKKCGGIAGIHQELMLSEHTGTLTAEDAATLKHWLSKVDFFGLTEDKSGPMYYDGFSYSITAAHGRLRPPTAAGIASSMRTKV